MEYWLLLLLFLCHAVLFGSSLASKTQLTSYVTKPTPHTLRTPLWTFVPNCWTVWFDRDDPADTGDWETLFDLRHEHPGKICDKPLQIQVQTTGGAPAASTGEIFFKFDTVAGFACRNMDQAPACKCHDYRVRFMCPFSFCYSLSNSPFTLWHDRITTTPTPTPPTTTPPSTTPPTTTTHLFNQNFTCWTNWFNQDDPSGGGEYEALLYLRPKFPGQICPKPLQIQVETTNGIPLNATGDVIYRANTESGLICRSSDQETGRCRDYRVRFLCPLQFCIQSTKVPFTLWHDHITTTPTPTPPTTTPPPPTPTTTPYHYISPHFIKYPFLITRPPLVTRPKITHKVVTRPTRVTAIFQTPCWTQWFDRDDPAGSGDWETLLNLHLQNPGKICLKPLQILVQTTSGQPVSSTGDVIYRSDTVTGFICKNSDQRKGLCSDYKVRFRCPPAFCAPPPPCWTDWFDRDDPAGTGDYETLQQLRSQYPGQICSKPLQIQIETMAGVPLSATGDVIYKADTVSGFICRNLDQKTGRCRDYRVRFLCPLKFCIQSKCWTQWFDRDDPSGTGDWETLASLHISYPEQICDAPLQIQAQTTTGLPAITTGNTFAAYDTTVGLICKNSEQRKGMRCHDFQVRFLCPPEFCRPKGCFTEWFDRDDPSGSGDWETLFALRAEYPGHVCNSPLQIQVQTTDGYSVAATSNILSAADVTTGLVCQNSAQPVGHCHDFKVRFVCPIEFCQQKVCWTNWYDRDDPAGTGDWELLTDLRKLHPNEICDTPLYIDVRTVDTNQPITTTGQVLHIYSPTQGLACRNEDQRGCKCRDYKVRFGCPCRCTVDTL